MCSVSKKLKAFYNFSSSDSHNLATAFLYIISNVILYLVTEYRHIFKHTSTRFAYNFITAFPPVSLAAVQVDLFALYIVHSAHTYQAK